MVSIIQMGKAGSSIAIAMFAKQIEPWRKKGEGKEKKKKNYFDYEQKPVQRINAFIKKKKKKCFLQTYLSCIKC